MTVDEMINILKFQGWALSIKDKEAVIAALKAGQAMREVCNEYLVDILEDSRCLQTAREVSEAYTAWDAATKETT